MLVLVLVMLLAQRAQLEQGLRLLRGILLRQLDSGAPTTAGNAALARRQRGIATRGPSSQERKDGTPLAKQEPGAWLKQALAPALALAQPQRLVLVLVLVLLEAPARVRVPATLRELASEGWSLGAARRGAVARRVRPKASPPLWWKPAFPASQQAGQPVAAR